MVMFILGAILVIIVALGAFVYWAPQITAHYERKLEELEKDQARQRDAMMNDKLNEFLNLKAEMANEEPDGTPDSPGLGGGNWWFVVRSDTTEAVVEALGIEDPVPCNWSSASALLSNSFCTRTFVAPPIDGWVIVGGGLPDPPTDWHEGETEEEYMAPFRNIAIALSKTFGDAQFFLDSDEGLTICLRAIDGTVTHACALNAYMEAPSPWNRNVHEIEVPKHVTDRYGYDPENLTPEQRDELLLSCCATVVAGQWSVDPLYPKLEDKNIKTVGLVGTAKLDALGRGEEVQ